ncbi:hypothetical protein BJ742DRAFT_286314 [Cladochytrium replicatum]|nr:hypothetical protein BJ742DRAFT_286314 [Cladochytrium replicatum]
MDRGRRSGIKTPLRPRSVHQSRLSGSWSVDDFSESRPESPSTVKPRNRTEDGVDQAEKPEKHVSFAAKLAQTKPELEASPKPAIKAIVPGTYLPVRSTKPPTIPKEFNFCTTKRREMRKSGTGVVQSGGIKKTMPSRKTRDLTIPRPFNLRTNLLQTTIQKRLSGEKSPYVPLVVKLKKFEKETPERFKVQPKKRQTKEIHALTNPKSPFLRTKHRPKVPLPPSTEERILEEVSKVPPFKAHPILESDGNLGVPPVAKRPLTIPASPAIHKPKPPAPLPPPSPRVIKANPLRLVPPFEPKLEHRIVKPDDIELPGEEISEKKRREFEEKRRREEEEAARMREFHAQPLPNLDIDIPPRGEEKPPTQPEPFNLETDKRGELYRRMLEYKLAREEKENEAQRNFKAQPVVEHAPFVPKRSTKPPTEPAEIPLKSTVRANERKAFDEAIKLKEIKERELREKLEKQRQGTEEVEALKARKQAKVKAQPIRHFAPIVVQPSQKRITIPESPMIGEKRKRLQAGSRLREEVTKARNL